MEAGFVGKWRTRGGYTALVDRLATDPSTLHMLYEGRVISGDEPWKKFTATWDSKGDGFHLDIRDPDLDLVDRIVKAV